MKKIDLPIIWEDADMMVINKPPKVVVNRADSVGGETVADWADRRLFVISTGAKRSGEIALGKGSLDYARDDREADVRVDMEREELEVFRKRCGVAHRLDKETSGCLLIAKNPKALTFLLKQFHDRIIKKEYLALVHGRLSPKEGTIRLPLGRSRFDREKWEIKYSGKMAETTWKVEQYFDNITLVRLFPKTGRTHQIRVHLAHLGFPIFSDEKYLTKSLIASDRGKLPYHFLHAQKLSFFDMSGKWQSVSAPLPSETQKLLLWIESE